MAQQMQSLDEEEREGRRGWGGIVRGINRGGEGSFGTLAGVWERGTVGGEKESKRARQRIGPGWGDQIDLGRKAGEKVGGMGEGSRDGTRE